MLRKLETEVERKEIEKNVNEYEWLVNLLVNQALKRLPPLRVIKDDLVAAGNLGLWEASRNFEPSRGLKFKTYASYIITGRIKDEGRYWDFLPRSMRDRFKKIKEAIRVFKSQLNREPTIEEIREQTRISKVVIHHYLLLEVDEPVWYSFEEIMRQTRTDEGNLLYKYQEFFFQEDQCFRKVLFKEQLALLEKSFVTLNEKEKIVFSLYFYERLKMKEIGEILNVSESRVSQIYKKAKGKIEEFLDQDKTY